MKLNKKEAHLMGKLPFESNTDDSNWNLFFNTDSRLRASISGLSCSVDGDLISIIFFCDQIHISG